jgi:predicted nucleic acid-binding protein
MDTKFGEACARIIEKIAGNELNAVASTLVLLEVANALRKFGLRDIKDEIDAICSLGMTLYPVNEIITKWAGDIFQKVKISPYNCAHVATMKKAGVSKILSADKDFDKISEIQRIDPNSFDSTLLSD